MFVFPRGNPRLDILTAAGTAIAEGTPSPVRVDLSAGLSTNQIVRVQARNFTNDVPLTVKITPENGPSASFNAVIPLNSGNPPFVDVSVIVPVDSVAYIHAFTR